MWRIVIDIQVFFDHPDAHKLEVNSKLDGFIATNLPGSFKFHLMNHIYFPGAIIRTSLGNQHIRFIEGYLYSVSYGGGSFGHYNYP